jgi:GTP-binding protein Era
MNSDKTMFLSGFVAIVGPPNVGKSTLLNRILGTKIAIVSPKPQTTRNRILGIYHGEDYQIAFMDTPGIHRTRTPLHKSMIASAQEAFHEVDIILMVIEMSRPDDADIPLILKNLEQTKKPSFLIINKIDTGSKKKLLPIIESFSRLNRFDAIIPISAFKGEGIEQVLKQLRSRLKPGPAFFPKEIKTDQSDSFLISEMIREKVFLNTRQELPYSSAVTVDRIEDKPDKNLITVTARIHVESDSQKGVLIGQKGRMIKAIGKSARRELERIFETRVFLDLTVRVEKNWSRDTRALRRLGY